MIWRVVLLVSLWLRTSKCQRSIDDETERSLIIGGHEVTEKEYPFFTQGPGCGASLIWKDIVLTAAHCKGHFSNAVLVGARQSYTKDAHSEIVSVATGGEIVHPEYDGRVFKDYMIVILDREVTNQHGNGRARW